MTNSLPSSLPPNYNSIMPSLITATTVIKSTTSYPHSSPIYILKLHSILFLKIILQLAPFFLSKIKSLNLCEVLSFTNSNVQVVIPLILAVLRRNLRFGWTNILGSRPEPAAQSPNPCSLTHVIMPKTGTIL